MIRLAAVCVGAAIVIVIVTHGWDMQQLPGAPPFAHGVWRYLAVGLLGGIIGFAELVSRYRDEPLLVTRSPPGLFYILFNAGSALIALAALEHYRDDLHPPADGYSRVMVAGFGAMLILRSKLLTFRQPGGTDVAVGPAFIVDTLVAAINRAVDRWRAQARYVRVARLSQDFATLPFETAEPSLTSALLAFQNMEPEALARLRNSFTALSTNTTLAHRDKFARAGFDILTECGEAVFDRIFEDLRRLFLPRT